jgi:predicted dehydrogenase
MMTILRTGLIGCGKFANKHLANLAAMPEKFESVAFCDIITENAVQYAEKYSTGKAKVFSDYHQMFDQVALDLVLICLPPFGHKDEVEAAAEHGVNILIEKPIALTSEHAWKMVEAVEKASIKSQVGFMFRFGAAIEKLKSMIQDGSAGQVGLMSARYFCNSLHAAWWREREKSGGQITEQVIHMVDLMRYLMGDPQLVYSIQNNLFHKNVENYTIEDTSGTVMEFRDGGIGVIFASNNAIPGKWLNDYHIVTQKLTAEFSDANHATFTYTGGQELKTESISSDENYYLREMLDLYQAIVSNTPTRTPIEEGARTLDLALAITESALTHKPVQMGSK